MWVLQSEKEVCYCKWYIEKTETIVFVVVNRQTVVDTFNSEKTDTLL